MWLRIAFVFVFSLFSGCKQELVDSCGGELDCVPCATDAECVVVTNACQPTASCAHADAGLMVSQEGCSIGYEVPSDSECTCQDSVCSSK